MIYYSKEWCDMFLGEDWLQGFSLVPTTSLASLEVDNISSKAISGFLLKDKLDKKPIELPGDAYLALSKAEAKRKEYYNKAKQNSNKFDDKNLPAEISEMFDTGLFHDATLLKIVKKGSSVELIIRIDGVSLENAPYRKLVFYDGTILGNEIESSIPVRTNEEGLVESDYTWVYHEVCRGYASKYQIHVAIDRWRRLKGLVLEFDKCTIQECDVSINGQGYLEMQ